MIDIQIHRRILLNILNEIYRHSSLAGQLGFKGGTCLYFFHDLPRFSTDLDFNLLCEPTEFTPDKVNEIAERYMKIKDYENKQNTWIWEGSYQETHHNIKIEISKREYPDKYVSANLYGLTICCLEKSYQFAHKLCAILDRKMLAHRDLFDAHFMFQKQFPLNEEIIHLRTGLQTRDYFNKIIQEVPGRISKRGILDGLGEVLNEQQKKDVKKNLIDELFYYLRSY